MRCPASQCEKKTPTNAQVVNRPVFVNRYGRVQKLSGRADCIIVLLYNLAGIHLFITFVKVLALISGLYFRASNSETVKSSP
jgi:hypothetical protein